MYFTATLDLCFNSPTPSLQSVSSVSILAKTTLPKPADVILDVKILSFKPIK